MVDSTKLLQEKKVIVIGGSSGIGRSVAAAALANGASVVISSSSQERVNAAVEKLKQGIQGASDVSVTGQVFDMKDFKALKSFLSQEGPFDHLVITAGTLPGNLNFPHEEIDENSLKPHFDSRYWALVIAAQHIYKNNLIKPGGSITTTIGTSHHRPQPGWGLTNGFIGAVESSTRGLSIDLKPIRVNSIAPGLVDTEIFANTTPEARDQIFKVYEQKLLVGHVGTPDELAEAYIFAMKCTYLTGQVIVVDGGGILV